MVGRLLSECLSISSSIASLVDHLRDIEVSIEVRGAGLVDHLRDIEVSIEVRGAGLVVPYRTRAGHFHG